MILIIWVHVDVADGDNVMSWMGMAWLEAGPSAEEKIIMMVVCPCLAALRASLACAVMIVLYFW